MCSWISNASSKMIEEHEGGSKFGVLLELLCHGVSFVPILTANPHIGESKGQNLKEF